MSRSGSFGSSPSNSRGMEDSPKVPYLPTLRRPDIHRAAEAEGIISNVTKRYSEIKKHVENNVHTTDVVIEAAQRKLQQAQLLRVVGSEMRTSIEMNRTQLDNADKQLALLKCEGKRIVTGDYNEAHGVMDSFTSVLYEANEHAYACASEAEAAPYISQRDLSSPMTLDDSATAQVKIDEMMLKLKSAFAAVCKEYLNVTGKSQGQVSNAIQKKEEIKQLNSQIECQTSKLAKIEQKNAQFEFSGERHNGTDASPTQNETNAEANVEVVELRRKNSELESKLEEFRRKNKEGDGEQVSPPSPQVQELPAGFAVALTQSTPVHTSKTGEEAAVAAPPPSVDMAGEEDSLPLNEGVIENEDNSGRASSSSSINDEEETKSVSSTGSVGIGSSGRVWCHSCEHWFSHRAFKLHYPKCLENPRKRGFQESDNGDNRNGRNVIPRREPK
ncbi:unnamed protein product [Orchesella dallaii]|uniref:Uncharacterized protein n=1 Tax=Orchesella dallaii TaxID=48710 RepID=A0ABP1RMZ6_9HEXA